MKRNSAIAVGAGVIAAAVLLSGCSSGGGTTASTAMVSQADITKAMNTPTTLTFWSFAPGMAPEIAAFEKKYPKIKVDLVNAGQSAAEYTKLDAALTAGKGAPDVAQLEYSEVPSFTVTNSVVNLAPYGAASLKDQYTPAAWSYGTSGADVWGIPQDFGPMGFIYRNDILAKAGITTAPATWAQFATDAAAVKSKTGSYLANFNPTDSPQVLGLIQQAGGIPFAYNGKKTVTVDLESPQVKEVSDYLTKIIQSGDVSVDPGWTDDWFQSVANGRYAGWVVGAWGPDDLSGTAANTSGKWTAAPMPQWTAGQNVGGDWGGSVDSVIKGTSHPIQAYEFIKYLNNDSSSATELAMNPKSLLFPTKTSVLADPAFASQKVAFFGGQETNTTFSDIAKTVPTGFGYLPYMDYATSDYINTVGAAITAKTDIYTAMKKWQNDLVAYGKKQGFTVNAK
jgi:multiple sugar transport system substrate-binding protein